MMSMRRQPTITVAIHQIPTIVHHLQGVSNNKNSMIGSNRSNKLLNNKNEVAKFNLIFYGALTVKLTFSHFQATISATIGLTSIFAISITKIT